MSRKPLTSGSHLSGLYHQAPLLASYPVTDTATGHQVVPEMEPSLSAIMPPVYVKLVKLALTERLTHEQRSVQGAPRRM